MSASRSDPSNTSSRTEAATCALGATHPFPQRHRVDSKVGGHLLDRMPHIGRTA